MAAVLGLLVACLVGCRGGSDDVIHTEAEFDRTLLSARDLALGPMRAFEDGQTPDELAAKDLREAKRLFDKLMTYRPGEMRLYIGAAQLDVALDQRESAHTLLRQALANQPAQPSLEEVVLIAEAYHLASILAFRAGDFRAAEQHARLAVTLAPDSPKFRTQRASALIQLGRIVEARVELETVLSDAPDFPPATRLHRLLEIAERP